MASSMFSLELSPAPARSCEGLRWVTRGLRRARMITAVEVAVVLSAAVAQVFAQAPPPLVLVSTAWTPFTNDAGLPRFGLDLVDAALDRIKRTAKTTIVPPAQYTTSLLSGPFDGSAAAWKDPERESVLLFSQPYLENRLVLVGRRGADVSAKALAALEGQRVAIVEGYSYGDAVDKSGAIFVRAATDEESLALLLKQAVDYTLMDDLVVEYILRNHPKESATRLQIGSTPLVTRELHLAIRRSRPDAEAIIAGFNAQLRGMVADRTYHRLLNLEWIGADVDGDGVPEYVPASDRTGPAEPQRVYTLLSSPSPQGLTINTRPDPDAAKKEAKKPGFYIGGSLYSDWASVPENYKTPGSLPHTPGRSTASIFNFSW
jgi:polar amino acid transport system substrate-binding protein